MKFRFKNTETTIKIIGYYQIIGGIVGIVSAVMALFKWTNAINGPLLLIYLFAFFLFAFSIQSGNLIVQKNKRKKGIIYSMIMQGLQIILIAVGGNKYEFYSGFQTAIGFNFTNEFQLQGNAAISGFNFSINSDEPEFYIFINIFAIIVFSILTSIYRETQRDQALVTDH